MGSVSLSLAPLIRLAPYRPPWQTQARLQPQRPDSREPASELLSLTVALLPHCRKRLPPERQSPEILPRFPCYPLVSRSLPPALSAPAPCPEYRRTPRCRMRAPVQRPLQDCLR